jgi:peptidoglycan/LPS O-acetylase OafA/YrhL
VLRSIGAVLAGLLANFALSGGTDAGLHATGIYPPMFQPMADHLWALALTYRVVFAVVGGFLTARLAPTQPMRHVMALGGIGTVLGVLSVLATWNKGPEFGPHWFSMCVTITGLPCTVLGGVLHARRIARTHP